jgi:transposase
MFTREFKVEAVKLINEWGVKVSQAARDLGIGEYVLGRWVREAAADKGSAFPSRGVMKPEDAEVARLRKELARAKAERAILKKPSPSLPRNRRNACPHCSESQHLAEAADVSHPRRLQSRAQRVARKTQERSILGQQ